MSFQQTRASLRHASCSNAVMTMMHDATMKTLNGTIVYEEDISVSPEDQVNVRIEDVSLMDVSAVIITETNVNSDQQVRTSPISYSLEYDETKITDGRSYALRATIRDKEGKLLWITDTHTPVLSRGGRSDNVEVKVKRVAR